MARRTIIWLTKRRYMGKDLLADRYGRYFEIPVRLADHDDIQMFALDYRPTPIVREQIRDGFAIASFGIHQAHRFIASVRLAIRRAPDALIVAGSDAPYCIMARHLAASARRLYAIDLYDDYETFSSAKIPFVNGEFRKSLLGAATVVSFEQAYADALWRRHAVDGLKVAPNGVDAKLFRQIAKTDARRSIGLPEGGLQIGYFGAIDSNRTFDDILRAFALLRRDQPAASLLLAGPTDNSFAHDAPGIRYFGQVSQEHVVRLVNACDVAVATVRKDSSAAICFPTKLMEYIACRRPFVTPDIGGASTFLQHFPEYRYTLGDAAGLADRILANAAKPDPRLPPLYTWDDAAADFAQAIGRTVDPSHVRRKTVDIESASTANDRSAA